MELLSLVFLFLCCHSIFAASSSSSNSAGGDRGENRLAEDECYDVNKLSQVYYGRLQEATRQDSDRFERLVVVLESDLPQDPSLQNVPEYSSCLYKLFHDNLFEEFQTLFPLIRFNDDWPYDTAYDVELMLDCLDYNGERAHFGEFMLTQNFDPERFVEAAEFRMGECGNPEGIIDVIEWLAQRNEYIAESKLKIYQNFLGSTLSNWDIDDEEKMVVVKRLVELGAIVDDKVVDDMDDVMGRSGTPGHLVDIIDWLLGIDNDINYDKAEIYQHWIILLANNTNIRQKDCIKLIRRLVSLGAMIDDEVKSECRYYFSDAEGLHQFLDFNTPPDAKQPEC